MYTFVTGGYRSGRSNYALRRAAELGQPPWLYVSTGLETDEAVRKRIERHRRDMEAIWRTAVMPDQLADLVAAPALDGYGAAVIDDIAGWIESHLVGAPQSGDARLFDEVVSFAERLYRQPVPVVVVSTEMGLGMVPRDAQELRLLEIVARTNQLLAEQAGSVVLMVSGVPLKIR